MNKNYKTTLLGIFGGFLLMFGNQIGSRLQGDVTMPPVTLNNVLTGVAVAALGYQAKDKDVTGGTRHQ